MTRRRRLLRPHPDPFTYKREPEHIFCVRVHVCMRAIAVALGTYHRCRRLPRPPTRSPTNANANAETAYAFTFVCKLAWLHSARTCGTA